MSKLSRKTIETLEEPARNEIGLRASVIVGFPRRKNNTLKSKKTSEE